jgi:hypothetical protein
MLVSAVGGVATLHRNRTYATEADRISKSSISRKLLLEVVVGGLYSYIAWNSKFSTRAS